MQPDGGRRALDSREGPSAEGLRISGDQTVCSPGQGSAPWVSLTPLTLLWGHRPGLPTASVGLRPAQAEGSGLTQPGPHVPDQQDGFERLL